MFRTITIAFITSFFGTLSATDAAETMLCNNFKPEQWIDVRLVSPHPNLHWWMAVPAKECSALEIRTDRISTEARDLQRNTVSIRMRCFPNQNTHACIIDNKR